MTVRNSPKPAKNPFIGWSMENLSMATEELADIVNGLSDLAADHVSDKERLKKPRNLKYANDIYDAFRYCRECQWYLSKEIKKNTPDTASKAQYAQVIDKGEQTASDTAHEISTLKEILADYEVKGIAVITRMGAITTVLGGVYALEMYMLFGSVSTKPFNDSLLAKALFTGAAAGVIYIGNRNEIDDFAQTANEIITGKGAQVPQPYKDTTHRIAEMTMRGSDKVPANDPVRPEVQETSLRTRRDILKFKFAPRR